VARRIARLLDGFSRLASLFDSRYPRSGRTLVCFWGLLFAWSFFTNALAGHWLTSWEDPDLHAEPARIARSLVEHGTFTIRFFLWRPARPRTSGPPIRPSMQVCGVRSAPDARSGSRFGW